MEIHRKIRIATSADEAWAVIGPEFAHVDKWASNVFVSTSHNNSAAPNGAPAGGRVCSTSQGEFDESIVDYDESRRLIAYAVTGKALPGFVKSIRASWVIQPAGTNDSAATMTMTADLAQPFAFLMGWMMKKQFGKAIDESLEEFKFYLEEGRVHPRKTEKASSKQAQKARAAA
ncbi:MAG: SRPBCC family protein [Pseudomonadota bacterium]